MLIYNYQKEFLGISEDELSMFGFSNLSELMREASDFADLFVKTPGFVHNFQHVHWIDFVSCAEGNEPSQVIIHVNGRNFRASLDIKTIYLSDDSSQKGYIITLINLREQSKTENDNITVDMMQRTASQDAFDTPTFEEPAKREAAPIVHEEPVYEPVPEPIPTPAPKPRPKPTPAPQVDDDVLDLFDDFDADFSELNEIDVDTVADEPISIEPELELVPEPELELAPEPVAVAPKATPKPVPKPRAKPVPKPKPKPKPKAPQILYVEHLEAGFDYIYDPQVACDELGLPVDLIEEFIEDFIEQAYEFRDELFSSLNSGDIDNVKILSHKLKGVAANLRVEDAFEVLVTINTSDDTDAITRNMNSLYLIIDKLAGKEPIVEEIEEEIEEEEELYIGTDDIDDSDDDDFIDFKIDDEPAISEDILSSVDDFDDDLLLDIPDTEDEILTPVASLSEIKYSKESVAKEIGLDAQSFSELFSDFIEEVKSSSAKIKKAISQSNSEMWRHDAIILKGMSDNMRMDEFTTELESIINTTDATTALSAVNNLDAKLTQLSQMEV